MKDRSAAQWEERARREPYFAVLTSDGSREVGGGRDASAAYFETGEADIASLLAAIASLLGHEFRFASALDFGCGAGRLTLPLARRATSVVACDIAPTMLAHARQNAQSAGLHNVTFLTSDELGERGAGPFDFVCSLLVFQYIAPAVGYDLVRTLLGVLAPGGIAALHLTFRSPAPRRFPSMTRHSPLVYRLIRFLQHRSHRLPRLQMSEYDERIIDRHIEAAGARVLGRFATHHSGTAGAVLIIQNA